MKIKDLTDAVFGRLTVVRRTGSTDKGESIWECVCICGRIKLAKASNLTKGSTRSCGCLAIEQKTNAAQHQCHQFSRTSKPREYAAWNGMIRRCYDHKHPSYARYGGRGITVDDSWRESFMQFCTDMGTPPLNSTLDRIDNDDNYSRANCRWATRKMQANNRRNNKLMSLHGLTMNATQWSEHLGWNKSTIRNRLYQGWSVERTLTEPPKTR